MGVERLEIVLRQFYVRALHVPTAELVPKMRKGIHKFYGRFCTEFIHNGRAKSEQERMPQLWLFPDLPVHKNKKSSLRDVTINGGLHQWANAHSPGLTLQGMPDQAS
jgi:hypothetical protein